MTDSRTYTVRGAEVIVTASLYPHTIDLHITVDLSPLDAKEPDHSSHQLAQYFDCPGYVSHTEYHWCKRHRKINVKTGSQARRVVKAALAKLDDAIATALIAREARKRQMVDIWA